MAKKKNDLLTLGILGVAAYFLFKGKNASASGYSSSGYSSSGDEYVPESVFTPWELAQRVEAGNYFKQATYDVASSFGSKKFMDKISSIPVSEFAKASMFNYTEDTIGSPLNLRYNEKGQAQVPVSDRDRKTNIQTIKTVGGFTKIRENTYRKKTGGGIAGGGSVRVIYT